MTRLLQASLIILTLLFFLGVAGEEDYQQEVAQAKLCQEMMELFKSSQGEMGWPPGTCTRG